MRSEEVISLEDLRNLPEYSCSIPTGTTIGKRWRCCSDRRHPDTTNWLIKTYATDPDPKYVKILSAWAVDENREPHLGDLS